MKLDATDLRYVSADAFRVLSAVEQGSKNHELVPSALIAQIAGSRSGGVNKALGELAKKKLVAKVQNAKYDGYRLTYGGYDFLACRTFAKRDTIYSVGNQIGTGKESDIYVVANEDEEQMVMKIHRLGRVSFRAIKSKRDYLRKGQSASWMYMSRLAAIKEFAFMKVLHDHGFPVPRPIDQSRHCLVMELIDAFPLRQISSVPSPGALYSALMDMIVRLARSGLIHGDFNEFNLLIRDHRTEAEKARDDETPDERDERIEREGGDFPLKVELEGEEYEERRRREKEGSLLEPVLIDFPQMVSTDHPDAEYYFNRDVECVRIFFARRFKYESSVYPKFSSVVRDGVREFDLDVEVAASGFKKEDRKALEEYMAELAAHEATHPKEEEREVASDEEYSDESEEEDEGVEARRGEGEQLPEVDKLRIGNSEAVEEAAVEESNEEPEEDDDEGSSEEDNNDASDADSTGSSLDRRQQQGASEPRTGRRPARQNRDVESIVSSSLSKQKARQERRHHGKKPVSANVLGRQKGSKKKQNANQREARAATKTGRGEAFF
ncbi:RIO kinase 2 [Rhodotorula toruloides]|uniref:Serine/threonine-protein kinase RIO2 n=1 Tax=Rhodotorula toruloides TaxID=5286 RepID=A0A511K9K6_RHOTO|nr:RIO kinase 2 [Rhodotorula toruloides]